MADLLHPAAVALWMEIKSRELPALWESAAWDGLFGRLATFVASHADIFTQAEGDMFIELGAAMHRRMVERHEAMSLTDIMIEQARNGGDK